MDRIPINFKTPLLIRQFLAEFMGTFFLVLIGDGAIAQYQTKDEVSFLPIALGYGLALMVGILVSGGVSGGHLNPAVTFSMAILGKCPWKSLPVYWAAQYLGSFLAASVLFGIYHVGLTDYLGGINLATAGIFASYPVEESNTITLAFDQILGSAMLLIIILAVTDDRNMKVDSGLVPLLIGLGLTAIHISLAYNAGCAINPARDFSPRFLTWLAGFGEGTFTAYDYFFWIPLVLPHVGGALGAIFYYLFISMHHVKEYDSVNSVRNEKGNNDKTSIHFEQENDQM